MKFLRYVLGLFSVLTALVALLIGAIELSAFGSRGFYEKQYEKLNVTEAVGMNMDDLMDVTDHMLLYLQGKEDSLSVTTTMWGEERDFFNDRERAHMVDVKNLNIHAVTLMKYCFLFSILYLILLFVSFHTKKGRPENGFFLVLCRSVIIGTVTFIATILIGALVVSTDFDHYWRIFHTIFFTNDLWLLDPSTDMLINIVPLGFFTALVARCAVTFVLFMLLLLIPSAIYLILRRKKIKKRKGLHLSPSLFMTVIITISLLSSPINCLGAEEQDLKCLPDAPEITADAAILIDRNTGAVLYEKNGQKSEYPASTTKIMTALLTLESCDLTETVDFTKTAIYALTPGASHIGMTVGEELTVEQCLYGLLLPSANEVANALAEHVSGSMGSFVELMNQRAAELGCVNTHFANPNGLHDENHTTCAYDLALIFSACLDIPAFVSIDKSVTYVIGETNLVAVSRPMKTTHKMLQAGNEYYDSRVICGKTGHTPEAGGCLVTYAKDGATSLICVVLGAEQPSEYTDTKALLDYGFTRFYQADTLNISSLITSSDRGSSFFTSKQITPMTISHTSGIITDEDDMEWTIGRDGDFTVLHLSSGSLQLGEIFLSSSIQSDNPQEYKGLPSTYLKIMQPPKESLFPLIVLISVSILAVGIIASIIYNSKRNVMMRREKSTRVFKNVNLKKIKI